MNLNKEQIEEAAKAYVLGRFNGGVSPTTEGHCIASFIAGYNAANEKIGKGSAADQLTKANQEIERLRGLLTRNLMKEWLNL